MKKNKFLNGYLLSLTFLIVLFIGLFILYFQSPIVAPIMCLDKFNTSNVGNFNVNGQKVDVNRCKNTLKFIKQTTYRLKNECEKKNYYTKIGDVYAYFCYKGGNIHSRANYPLLTPEELKSNFHCDVEYKIINPNWVEEEKRYVECDNGFKGFIEGNRINVATEQGNPTSCDEYIKTICREKN